MAERVFSLEDQISFAEISGDYNPLHLDPILARRLMYGKPVVHGVHAVLWAFDIWLKERKSLIRLNSLDVDFILPIAVNASIQMVIFNETDGELKLHMLVGGSIALKIKVDFSPSPHQAQRTFKPVLGIGECRTFQVDDLSGVSGKVSLNLDNDLADRLFPYVNRFLPSTQISELLATTRIVGMECPGFNSLFSGLSLKFTDQVSDSDEMSFHVEKFDARFSRVILQVSGASASGKLYVFYRPSNKQQQSYLNIQKFVSRDEFSGQRAVVIGGSRGLGEVTAKLLSAGGAEVVITYYRGSQDANSVVSEIASGGGKASTIAYDIMSPPADLASQLRKEWWPTHLYYFATPFIFEGKRGKFNPELYSTFSDYYVKGFISTIHAFRDIGCKFEKVFYPSSVAIDELPEDMIEYSAAKAAGECVCQFLDKTEKETEFVFLRLSRLDTDQTASIFQVENTDPVPYMLRIIQKLNQ